MNILCISNYYPPYYEGGYEISVKESMDYLRQNGHKVFILCGNKGIAQPPLHISEVLEGEPIRVLQYIDYNNASFINKHRVEVFNYRITQALIKAVNPDIVYIANLKAISIAPVIAVQKLKIKRVFDLGDIWLKAYTGSSLKSRTFRFLKSLLPCTIGGHIDLNPVIVISEWMKQVVSEQYGSKEIYLVPRGISLNTNSPVPFEKPFKYIFAGRIEPLKGLDICIQALILILKNDPSFPFVLDIYGEEDIPFANRCRELISSSGLQDRFRWLGKSTKLNEILPAYHVLLMPTMAQEAFGRIVIEAMSAGVIVVATNAYGPKEIIDSEKDGFLFERGSSVDLAAKIIRINSLDLSTLEQIRNNAMLKVKQLYEVTVVKKKLMSILHKLVKE